MLANIYYGEMNNFDYLAGELVIAADRYRIENLKMICEQKLISLISADNCIDLFELVDAVSLKQFEVKLISLSKENGDKIQDSNIEDWIKTIHKF